MVTYLERALRPGETVIYRAQLTPFIYANGLFAAAFAVPVFVFGMSLPDAASEAPFLMAAAPLFIGVVLLVGAFVARVTTEIAVTDQRIILKRGLVRRDTVEMNVGKVESVDIRQSVLGRIFNFGTVLVRGTGAGLAPLRYVEDPLALRSAITN